jgi:hypothetical protein
LLFSTADIGSFITYRSSDLLYKSYILLNKKVKIPRSSPRFAPADTIGHDPWKRHPKSFPSG